MKRGKPGFAIALVAGLTALLLIVFLSEEPGDGNVVPYSDTADSAEVAIAGDGPVVAPLTNKFEEREAAVRAKSDDEPMSLQLASQAQAGFLRIAWKLPAHGVATILAGPYAERRVDLADLHLVVTENAAKGTSLLEVPPGTWGVWLESESVLSAVRVVGVRAGEISTVSLKGLRAVPLSGLIVDQSTKLPVEGASIALAFSAGTIEATSGADGRFVIDSVPLKGPSTEIRVTAEGYAPEVIKNSYDVGAWKQIRYDRSKALASTGDMAARWKFFTYDERPGSYPDCDVYVGLLPERRITGWLARGPDGAQVEIKVTGSLELHPSLWRPLHPSVQTSSGGEFSVNGVHPEAAYILAFRSGEELQQLIAVAPGDESVELGQVTLDVGGSIEGFLPAGSRSVSIRCDSVLSELEGFPRFVETHQEVDLIPGDSFRFGGLRGFENVLSLRDGEGALLRKRSVMVASGSSVNLGDVLSSSD